MKACLLFLILLGTLGSFNTQAGVVVRLFYDNWGDGEPGNLRNRPNFPRDSLRNEVLNDRFENLIPQNSGELFGTFVRGYIEAPIDGPYYFTLLSDDRSALWLSTDHSVANLRPEGIQNQNNDANLAGPFHFESGKKYYFEYIHIEGLITDYFQVKWKRPDGVFEAPMSAKYLTPFPVDANQNARTTRPVVLNGAWNTGVVLGQPRDTAAREGEPATFMVTYEATQPATCQWRRNGVPIPGANLSYYTFQTSSGDNNAKYDVVISNSEGRTTSTAGNLTVLDNPLTITSAITYGNTNGVDVTFSHPVQEASATKIQNYSLSNGSQNVPVTAAAMVSTSAVRLTAALPPGKGYTLTVTGVLDKGGEGLNPSPSVRYFSQSNGYIDHRLFLGIGSGGIDLITNSASYISDTPDWAELTDWLEHPLQVLHDNMGAQFRGYLTPPRSGQYTFYVSSDDQSGFFISTDETPEKRRLVCIEPGAAGFREYHGGSNPWAFGPAGRFSANYANLPNNISSPINLVAGRRYFIEALLKENGGGECMSVAWSYQGELPPTNGAPPIGVEFLSSFDYSFGPAAIVTQPASVSLSEFNSAAFEVVTGGAPKLIYQWYRNNEPILDATQSRYSVDSAPLSESGAKYRVRVSNRFSSVMSEEAVLTVLPPRTDLGPLSILRDGESIKVTWTESGRGAFLEWTDILSSPPNWTVIPESDSGLEQNLTVGNAPRYFRLIRN